MIYASKNELVARKHTTPKSLSQTARQSQAHLRHRKGFKECFKWGFQTILIYLLIHPKHTIILSKLPLNNVFKISATISVQTTGNNHDIIAGIFINDVVVPKLSASRHFSTQSHSGSFSIKGFANLNVGDRVDIRFSVDTNGIGENIEVDNIVGVIENGY